MSTATAPVSAAQQPALLTFRAPQTAPEQVTTASHTIIGVEPDRDRGYPPATTWAVEGCCGGSPWRITITVNGGPDSPGALSTPVAEIEEDLRWQLEPFLGVLCAEQVAALIDSITDGYVGAV